MVEGEHQFCQVLSFSLSKILCFTYSISEKYIFNLVLKSNMTGFEKMAQWIKYSMYKHEDVSGSQGSIYVLDGW